MKLSIFKPSLIIIVSCCLLLVQSCIVHKLKVNRPEGGFYGIKSVIEENNEVSIFITHGMGISDLEFANPLINSATNSLSFKPVDTTFQRHKNSVVKIPTYKRENKELKFYIHGWYPATSSKWFLFWVDINKDRLETMDNIKYSLMNQSISDVIMYQGNFRDIIKKDLELTLELIVKDKPGAKFIGISESLGSKIFIETMNDNLKSNTSWANQWQENLTSVFMLSNQLPLLYLGDIEVKEWITDFESDKSQKSEIQIQQAIKEAYKPLLEFTKYGDRKNSKIQLVAISDPNDLLSYRVPESEVYSENYELTNVTVSVAVKGYSWPFGKPKIVNPVDAHLNYQKNDNVINYLINGNSTQVN